MSLITARGSAAAAWLQRTFTPVRLFLILGMVFGLAWSIVTPPFQAPDEHVHFCRAYQLSTGGLLPEKQNGVQGGTLPSSVIETIEQVNPGLRFHSKEQRQDPELLRRYLRRSLEPENKRFYAFPSSALYPPAAYLPHAAGILLGRLMHASPLVMMYLGRFSALAFWLTMTGLALQIMPAGRWLLLAVALMPMSVFLGGAFNPDAVTNGLAFFALAFMLEIARRPGVVTGRQLALFGLILLVFALAKPGFALFALLWFLLPRHKWGSLRRHLLTGILLLALGYGLSLVWNAVVQSDLNWNAPFADYPGQRQLLMQNPLVFIKAALSSLWTFKGFYLRSHLGQLGSLDVVLPWHALLPVLVTILAAALLGKGMMLTRWQKGVLLTLFLGTLFQSLLALYLTASPLGSPWCVGFQGRYLIPVAPMFWLLWQNRRWRPARSWRALAGAAFLLVYAFALGVSTAVLIGRYY